MRKILIVAAALAMLLPHAAWAQSEEDEGLEVGDYAPSIEAAEWLNVEREEDIPSLTELRGIIVVLFFWVSWHEGGEYLLPYVNMLSYNPFGRTPDVFFIGVTDADRKATQSVIEESKVFFPVAVESEAAEEYDFKGGFGFVVVDPEGKIAFKGSGEGDVSGMANAIKDIRENSPPTKTHPDEARVCYRLLDEAHQLIRDEKYPQAFKVVTKAFRRAVLGDRLRSSTLELVDLLDQLGYGRLAGVEPLLEREKYEEAGDLLRLVMRRFRGLDCYKDAKARYEKLLEEDEDFKQAASKFDDEDAAGRLYLEARDDLKSRRFGRSYDKLNQILTEYPETQAAEYAEAMIDRMKRNKAFWLLIVDHQAGAECRQLLARARNLKAKGRYTEARQLLRRVKDDYPNTIWAQQAVEELKDMP